VKIQIIGATLHEQTEQDGTFSAWYTCNRCGQQLSEAEYKKTAKEASEEATSKFDQQSRNFCYTCGNKLTGKQVNY
jgi:hypothetical protein